MSDEQDKQKNTGVLYKHIVFYGATTTLLGATNLLIRKNLIAEGVTQSDFVMMLSYGLLFFGIIFLAIGLAMLTIRRKLRPRAFVGANSLPCAGRSSRK